ncbi:MAG: hypothetical protein J6K50_00310 [Clostridia bacterium]|nr:hypothetical protein [Clostridia bacterium]
MENPEMYDFIADLDEYFCEKYANYDKLCVLPGYRMPQMQTSEVRADGRTYAYTLPNTTMRLALQENKLELLKTLKTQMADKSFSFSFQPLRFFTRMKNKFSSVGFVKILNATLAKYNLTPAEAGNSLDVSEEIWNNICKGNFLPTKNLVFSLALTAHISVDDMVNLLGVCGYGLDYSIVKDVVVSYLLEQKVFNRGMIDAAFAEYKVENLFLKGETETENSEEKRA